MIYGLVSCSGERDAARAARSLSDCDCVLLQHDQGNGQAWARNRLLDLALGATVVRYCDDDDVAASTRRAAERLVEAGVDVLAFSYVAGSTRVEVPGDPLAAAIDSVGPWSWVARVEALRRVPWGPHTFCTGTWHWLAMMDAGLSFAFAPDIWGYHWAPNAQGVTAAAPADNPLFPELERRILDANRLDLLPALERRKQRWRRR